MSDDRSKIIDRILALRESNGRTAEEAEVFVSKAMAIMAEHQVTEHELRTGHKRTVGDEHREYHFGNANQGVFGLICTVAPVFDCAAIGWVGERFRGGRWKRTVHIHAFGTEADRSIMFTFVEGVLLPQLVRAIGRDRPRSRASYATAWAFEVSERIAAERARVFDEAGVALIPFDEPNAMAEGHIGGPPVTLGGTDLGSTVAGMRAGQTADIGNPALDPSDRPQVPTSPLQLGAGEQPKEQA